MRTTDPIGRWGPYAGQRRQARRRAALVLCGLAALGALAYLFAAAAVHTAP